MGIESARTAAETTTVILGVVFNIIIIIVYCRGNRCPKKNYQVMIINLSAASLVTALILCLWLFSLNKIPGTNLSDGVIQCQVISVLFMISAFIIPYAVVAIALERTVVTFTQNAINQKTLRIVLLTITWFLAIISSCEILLQRQLNGSYCVNDYKRVFGGNRELAFWIRSSLGLIPALGMLGLSIAVCIKSCMTDDIARSKRREARMFLTLAIVTFLTWSPVWILDLYSIYRDAIISFETAQREAFTVEILLNFNLISPFLVYVILDEDFRRDLVLLITSCYRGSCCQQRPFSRGPIYYQHQDVSSVTDLASVL